MPENYGSVENGSGDGALTRDYKFKSFADYEATRLLKLEIEYPQGQSIFYTIGSLDVSTDAVPEQLHAVGVTAEAWGKFVADMKSAIMIESLLKTLAKVCFFLGIGGFFLLLFLLPQACHDREGRRVLVDERPEGGYCGISSSVFTYVHWFWIVSDILMFPLAFLRFIQYTEYRLEPCCEEMSTRCDATISAVFSGIDGYLSSDMNESWLEKRTKSIDHEKRAEQSHPDYVGPREDTGGGTVMVRVYKQIPGHILFVTVEKGRPAKKLV
jgi:hypothetical protein